MSRSPARLIASLLILAGLGVTACSGDASGKAPEQAPRRVEVAQAAMQRLPRTVVAVGTLAAEEHAELGFKVPGRLARWRVDLGSQVGVGAELAELDALDYELRLARARAAMEQARARLGLRAGGEDDELDPEQVGIVRQAQARLEQAAASFSRSRELRDQGILAQADFDASEAAFKVAQSQYHDALEEVNLRRSLFAPRERLLARVDEVLAEAGGRAGHIFNLGHGILPGTPVENVKAVVEHVHARTAR